MNKKTFTLLHQQGSTWHYRVRDGAGQPFEIKVTAGSAAAALKLVVAGKFERVSQPNPAQPAQPQPKPVDILNLTKKIDWSFYR